MANAVEQMKPDLESLKAQATAQGDDLVLLAITQNTELLQQLFDRLHREGLRADPESAFDTLDDHAVSPVDHEAIDAVDENVRLDAENRRLNERIEQLEDEIESLTEKNRDLAAQVVYSDKETKSSSSPAKTSTAPVKQESLSWEERKLQILEQLENDAFDAEEFLSTLHIENESESESDPVQTAIDYVNDLDAGRDRLEKELAQLRQQNESDQREIQSLKDALTELEETIATMKADPQAEEKSKTSASGSKHHSDLVNELLAGDEVVREEREKLQQMQKELDEKLRQVEIETSLDRAKHSRERTQWEQKNRELENQVAALQRQAGIKEGGSVGTRWMEKLGLTGGSKD